MKVQVFPVINFNLSHPKIEPIRGILTIEPLTGVTDIVEVWGQDFDTISICIYQLMVTIAELVKDHTMVSFLE